MNDRTKCGSHAISIADDYDLDVVAALRRAFDAVVTCDACGEDYTPVTPADE